ncbi:helix-turn-helix domain-containing protein [Adhaeretor mobilis]|uniref:Helix-turn-helix protein n=1 Tax=Adhaeretor mobilis TaxID=1930276 RepID=A0A517MTL4_9BACT|nr:helix-turn-helix transcriptional regulator [Adhaeretor mobilis]QDS98231.1 helix-turn-helix protein [Adhaeretor mobilis]
MNDSSDDGIDAESLGRKIRGALHRTGETPKWLAAQSGIGVSTVYSILNGHQLPSLDKIRQLCRVLNLSVDWLLDIESDSFYLRPELGHESQSYADLEEFWLSQGNGERLSVSRGFSIVHQPIGLREQVLKRIYELPKKQINVSLDAFIHRRQAIDEYERRRLEVVVKEEVEDFILQRPPWDRLDFELIKEFVEAIITRLREDQIGFELTLIPRQLFLVNYEILNREIIVFDLGHIFMRQSHANLVQHFIREIQSFRSHPDALDERRKVIRFLQKTLAKAGSQLNSVPIADECGSSA